MRRLTVVLAAAAAGLVAAPAAGATLVFELERYNRAYPGLSAEPEPIERGPLSVRLSAPRFDLEVLANRLELRPAGGCRHRGVLRGRFTGDGELLAEVELGNIPARFEDRVRVPEQERQIEARINVEPAAGGWTVTLEELPETVTVEVESELAGSLVAFCRRLSMFVAGDAGCGLLERSLSEPRLRLPEPGTRFLVRRDELVEEERRRLEAYLAAGDCAPPAPAG